MRIEDLEEGILAFGSLPPHPFEPQGVSGCKGPVSDKWSQSSAGMLEKMD